jgi:G3E family GTPase
VTDAKHLLREIDRAPEAQEQLAFADVILVSTTQLAQVQSRIAGVNPYATLHHTERCNVDLSKVL